MRCKDAEHKLSAYLDGELGDHDASALRGHLRTCDACRALADREAKLVDALRELPAVDPPAALWQGIRDRLAEQEIADAGAAWHLRLWRRARPYLPRASGGAVLAAAAAGLLLWHRASPEPSAPDAAPRAGLGVVTGAPDKAPAPVVDVAATLAEEAALIDASYDKAVAELVAMIEAERASWQPSYAQAYDERSTALRSQLARHPAGPERERAWQGLVRYLQTTLTRAELAMGGP